MSTQNFASAAIHVVGQYSDAGKTLVSAYRSGAHRLLNGAASRYGQFLGNRQLPLLNEDIKARLIGAQEKVNGFLANRLDIDTSRVVNVMDRVATGATTGIESVSKLAARVESPLGNSVLGTLNSLHMPIAQVSVQIADRIVAGAKKIEDRVAGAPVAKAARTVKAKAKPVARRAARTTRKA
ncbi:hypothetical protein [Variovorax sp. PBL-E5]|uniref:hypothetical protein n=1 Tax=Variovorax sp. PBL-E5 TaxID=434014 RepID=UPI0013A5BD65|nr:hypothetical protein [Variovorax sp. PBL-E5]